MLAKLEKGFVYNEACEDCGLGLDESNGTICSLASEDLCPKGLSSNIRFVLIPPQKRECERCIYKNSCTPNGLADDCVYEEVGYND